MKWPSHGSNPQYLFEAMGLPLPKRYIDFSANINPLGPPESLTKQWNEFIHKINVYPDPYSTRLKENIAEKENLLSTQVLIGNGGAEIITLIARMLTGKRVLIIQPTFSEYEKACKANGCEVRYLQVNHQQDWMVDLELLKEELRTADAMFLCNPNNPTGVVYSKSQIIDILKLCDKNDCQLILDEAFYDFLVDYKSITSLIKQYSNLIILRSMTKMFSIPGLRLGYVMATESVVEQITTYQSHWSVNTIAMLAGEACLEDEAFIINTQNYIQRERKRLFSFFEKENFIVSPSQVNFYLLRDAKTEDSFQLFTFLLQKGIIPRHTFNFPGLEGSWLRFAIKSTEENDQLMEVLQEWRIHLD
ncbi:threonine-phosphate decarboxylase CobD [Bacillus sp. 31A1R]|uniref:threonine-phosphate decarboxylase n=1 Tax=Robertmurraya mangrovi TaxID=3098077 RepID=A0ABU5J456_9BACI|nr:threonine-phosphate decarboxylase CobD [Bacillus sp. 31A1R]MDZ5474210.1 threonine-phosphate decarboxylase CobD [Bacillus sp. 31A1R]